MLEHIFCKYISRVTRSHALVHDCNEVEEKQEDIHNSSMNLSNDNEIATNSFDTLQGSKNSSEDTMG